MAQKDTRKVLIINLYIQENPWEDIGSGWLIYTRDGEFLGFIDGEIGRYSPDTGARRRSPGSGKKRLTSLFPNAIEIASIPVLPKTFNEARRMHILDGED